ncbi:hypothetical protein [Nitrospira sp. M1]
MKVRLYLDEDVDISLGKALEQKGIIQSEQRPRGEMLRVLSQLTFSLPAAEMKNRLEFLGQRKGVGSL